MKDPEREVGAVSLVARVLVSGLFVVAVYYAVFGGEYSVFELHAARVSVEEERVMLTGLEQDIDSLSALTDSLRNDAVTLERVAREKFGMIREGETLYRFAVSADSADAVSEAGEVEAER